MAEIPALPTHLTLEIVTPDRSVVADQVDEVEISAPKAISTSCLATRRFLRC